MRISDPTRGKVASRANELCEYCQHPQQPSTSPFQIDHIVPQSANGLTELNNLALACPHCNVHKATRQIWTDPLTKTDVRLFNPRSDNWTVHFLLNRKTGEIVGKTNIGRATVEALQMNADQPIQARRYLINLDVL